MRFCDRWRAVKARVFWRKAFSDNLLSKLDELTLAVKLLVGGGRH